MGTFGKRLRKVMRIRGVTQRKLAKAIGLSQSTISYYLSDKRKPTIDNAKRIADYLNVDLNWLLSGEEYDDERFKVGRRGNDHISIESIFLSLINDEKPPAKPKPKRGMLWELIGSYKYDLDTDALIIITALMKYLKKCSQK